MTDEEIQREREEAERLIREINATIDRINRVNQKMPSWNMSLNSPSTMSRF